MTRANQTVRNASLHIEKLPTVGIGFRIGICHEGPFLTRPVRSGDKSARSKQILCWQSQVAFVGSWIDGQCAGEECGPRRRGNTMFEIGNTIVREKTGVRLTNAHRSEIAASRHLAHRCLNGLAAEMLGLEAGQRDATMPRLTGFSVFDD
jgi:hypothetical protein